MACIFATNFICYKLNTKFTACFREERIIYRKNSRQELWGYFACVSLRKEYSKHWQMETILEIIKTADIYLYKASVMQCALLCFTSINVNILKFLFFLFLARKIISSQGKKKKRYISIKNCFWFLFRWKRQRRHYWCWYFILLLKIEY